MTAVLAIFLALHGLIHLLGFAKAFGLAELPQLTRPVTPAFGLLWLAAALLFVASAVALLLWPRWWWALGAIAITVSIVAIVPSWADAKFGALADAIALLAVIAGFLAQGPFSLRAEYERDVDRALARFSPPELLNEADLAGLPPPVQRYLRTAGVVGQFRVRNFRARMHGRIRSGPTARWMPIRAEQYNFYDEPARFFYLNASMFALPVQGYHRYAGSAATMRVRAAGLVRVAEASGTVMSRAETVTLLNDMCFLAPATLISPRIQWTVVDDRRVLATFTNAAHTVRAELEFNDADELVNFRSDDRGELASDGRTLRPGCWSTPLAAYRAFDVSAADAASGTVRLASRGEARYARDGAEYAYIEVTIDEVSYNLRRP